MFASRARTQVVTCTRTLLLIKHPPVPAEVVQQVHAGGCEPDTDDEAYFHGSKLCCLPATGAATSAGGLDLLTYRG